MSRGSVIPLFVEQVQAGPAADRDRSRDDPLPDVAGRRGRPGRARLRARPARGPLHPQGAGQHGRGPGHAPWPASMGADAELKVIGTRHGEKLYETLATREELARAEDQGDYFRVAGGRPRPQLQRVLRRGRRRREPDRRLPLAQHRAPRRRPGSWTCCSRCRPSGRSLRGRRDSSSGSRSSPPRGDGSWRCPLLRRARVLDVPNPRSSHAPSSHAVAGSAVMAAWSLGVLLVGAETAGVAVVAWSRSCWPSSGWSDDLRVPAGARPARRPGAARRGRRCALGRPTYVGIGPARPGAVCRGGLARRLVAYERVQLHGRRQRDLGASTRCWPAAGSRGSVHGRPRPVCTSGLGAGGRRPGVPALERAAGAGSSSVTSAATASAR